MTEEFESNLTDSHYTTEEFENPPPRYHSKAVLSFTENHCSPFVAQKEQNARHTRKISPAALCSQVARNILRSGRSCRKQLVVQAVGTKELAIHVITATPPVHRSNNFCSLSTARTAVCCDFYGAGFLWELLFVYIDEQ